MSIQLKYGDIKSPKDVLIQYGVFATIAGQLQGAINIRHSALIRGIAMAENNIVKPTTDVTPRDLGLTGEAVVYEQRHKGGLKREFVAVYKVNGSYRTRRVVAEPAGGFELTITNYDVYCLMQGKPGDKTLHQLNLRIAQQPAPEDPALKPWRFRAEPSSTAPAHPIMFAHMHLHNERFDVYLDKGLEGVQWWDEYVRRTKENVIAIANGTFTARQSKYPLLEGRNIDIEEAMPAYEGEAAGFGM